jgi:hypothetical protein
MAAMHDGIAARMKAGDNGSSLPVDPAAPNGLSTNRAPAADLHADAIQMAGQTGKTYSDCRTFLMCSRARHYGLSTATPSASVTAPDPEAEAVLNRRNEAIAEYRQANPTWTYERARNAVRNRLPGLFGLGGPVEVAPHSPTPAENGDTLAAIDEGIRELRAGNPELTYISARDLLRNRKPALFGISPLSRYQT